MKNTSISQRLLYACKAIANRQDCTAGRDFIIGKYEMNLVLDALEQAEKTATPFVKIKVDTDLDGSLLFMLAEAPDDIQVVVVDSDNKPMTAELTNENHGGPYCPRCGRYSENDELCIRCHESDEGKE